MTLQNGLRSSAFVAMLTLVALVGLPYALPLTRADAKVLERLRVFSPLPEGAALVPSPPAPADSAPVGETKLVFETSDPTELAQPEEVKLPEAAATVLPTSSSESPEPPRPIEDPSGHALDAFYDALAATEKKTDGAIARITYFGDSIVASDFVTATLRRKLQKRFGDAGHGFMLIASAWPGYFHNDVTRFGAPGWQMSRVVGPFTKDGLYGLGGVSFRSDGPGVFSRFSTSKTGNFGRAVSRFVVDYLEQPGGGRMQVKLDGEERATVDTSGPAFKTGLYTVDAPDGVHELEVRAMTANVRAFGVWMERDAPGVVLDAIGIQGCRIRMLDKNAAGHFEEQLAARNPSLTVFEFGMNESEDGELYPLDQYEATLKTVLLRVRSALPKSSCLLVGPLDRADKKGDVYTSRPVVPKLAAIQRKVSAEVGCGYWDTFHAMGGIGSMGIWVERGLGGADLAHPTSAGADVLGNWIYLALMKGYEARRAAAR